MGEFIVTTGSDVVDADDGELSLREAITQANGDDVADTITFDLDPGDTTLRLTQGTLEITNGLTIDGAGEITITGDVAGNDTVVNGVTDLAATDAVNLEDNVRLFSLSGIAADTTFSGLTLTGGNSDFSSGGAIRSSDSDVTVTNSTISGNTAGIDGGGIFNYFGANTVTTSTISGNMAGDDGGGIFNYFGANTVTTSTISGNMAGDDGGGIYNRDSANTVRNSTIGGNTAGSDGGGISNFYGTNTVGNSTISGNTAGSDGGGIRNVFANNTVANSILTGNYNGTTPNVAGGNNLEGGNIVGDTFSIDGVAQTMGLTSADIFAETAEIIVDGTATGVFAGVLADNGGDVQTVALLADADNVALDAVVAPPSSGGVDARGEERGQRVTALADGADDTPSDLGAFELQTSDIESDLVVTTTADGPLNLFDDELTLREALILANDGDTITFDLDPGDTTLRLTQGTLEITNELTIDGAGEITITGDVAGNDTVVNGVTDLAATDAVNLEDNVRLFSLSGSAADTTFSGLTLTGGNSGLGHGGAIRSSDSDITVTNSTISGNTAGFYGGGIHNSNGTNTVTTSTISGNTAGLQGGGISNYYGTNTVDNSTISDNTAGFYGGGISSYDGTNTVTNSTISGNTAGFDGGGISSYDGTNTVTNSTISGNTAGISGGGIHNNNGTNTVTNSILTGNYNESTLGNVLVGGNIVGDTFSIDGVAQTMGLTAADIFAETAEIIVDGTATGVFAGVLADNGGDVQTLALLADADNLALDNSSGDGPATDARGRSRSDFAGLGLGIADIGAFELLNVAPVLNAASFTIAENETDVSVVAASDDVDVVAFSISGGADAALFEIDASSGALRFSDAQNFEAPADADEDNVYEVVVAASDGNDESTQAFDVAVTDVAEEQTIIATPDGGTVTGSDEGDTVAGNTGDDVVNAGLGDDIIVDPGGDDTVNAGGGDDRVGLVSGMNTVSGGDGADLIVGGFGNDALMGDAGMDVIRGDVSTNLFGSDRITGGTGNDLLEGRGGVDTFVFTTGDGADTIGALDIDYVTPANTTVSGADFVSGVDLIELDDFGFADGAAALAQVTDVDGVATFSDQGTTITFAGLTVDDLSADDFILV